MTVFSEAQCNSIMVASEFEHLFVWESACILKFLGTGFQIYLRVF